MISWTTFFVAVTLLIGALAVSSIARRRGNAFWSDDSGRSPAGRTNWSARRLWLASFLTLFAELAFIRWIAVEVRVFAYFKNLALVLCFLGFGVGCALARQRSRWLPALASFFGLLLIVRVPHKTPGMLESLSQHLGGASDVSVWETPSFTDWQLFLAAAALATLLFCLIVLVFVPLGQIVSREMDRSTNSLGAYSWNLVGSLLGVVAFFMVSRLMLPPAFWMGIVLLGFALLQTSRRDALFVTGLTVPLILLLYSPAKPDTQIIWTPYQEIQYTRQFTSSGDALGGMLEVNHTLYQNIVNLSPAFLARYPAREKESDYDPYNLPFRFALPSPNVLVVGAGTGNDVAAALRYKSSRVDAVEIDPAILQLGKREHPEHPYDSPRVAVNVGDARNFFKRTHEQYDLILFGLLDSHGQLSDYSNMRIDNFVYTEESFREAAQHLSPNGIIFVKFQVNRTWLPSRLVEILRHAVESSPLAFIAKSNFTGSSYCFVASRGNRVKAALDKDLPLAAFVRDHQMPDDLEAVPITTDDWPYFYQKNRRIPLAYCSVSVMVILIALIFSLRERRARQIGIRFSFFFFSMGAGFLLLETQIISRLALFFGTVWQVNGIVISTLLLALLVSNAVVQRRKSVPKLRMWAGLLASLFICYWFPFERISAPASVVGTIAIGVFAIPVIFAGILFSCEFRNALSPGSALCSNVLGAVAGGLLENLSLVFGLRALLMAALALYLLAAISLWLEKTGVMGTISTPLGTDTLGGVV